MRVWLLFLFIPTLLLSQSPKQTIFNDLRSLRESCGLKRDLRQNENWFFDGDRQEILGLDHVIFPANQLSKDSDDLHQRNLIEKKWVQKANTAINLISQMIPEQICLKPIQDDDSTVFEKENGQFLIQGGLCTAASLKFARTYIDLKSSLAPSSIDDYIQIALQSTSAVKNGNDPMIAATQAAMNMIHRSHSFIDVNTYSFRQAKIETLLAFQYLKVTKCYPQFFTSFIYKEALTEWIDALDYGVHVLRLVRVAENEKGELFGHTLLYIKEDKISFLFDPNLGCVAFFEEDDPVEFIFKSIFTSSYHTFRAIRLNGIATFYKIESF